MECDVVGWSNADGIECEPGHAECDSERDDGLHSDGVERFQMHGSGQ